MENCGNKFGSRWREREQEDFFNIQRQLDPAEFINNDAILQ